MGTVAEYLHDLIARQVNEHRLVVWFDPERHYAELARTLSLPDTAVARYEGSFFALRREIEPLLNDTVAPRLVVYVPLSEEETSNALIELTTTGVVLKPGQNPMQRNTRLSVVARWALRQSLGQVKADEVARQVEAGKLTLADLDEVDEKYGDSAVLLSIFKSGQPHDVALALLGSDHFDADIMERDAISEVAEVLGQAYGIDLAGITSPQEVRERLAHHVIVTEFVASLHAPLPPDIESLKTATGTLAREACVDLTRTWRLRRDLSDCYAEHATRVETSLALEGMRFTIDQIRDCETFAYLERALQDEIGSQLQVDSVQAGALLALARQRQSSYWSERMPEVQAHWALVVVAGQLLEEARRIEAELKQARASPGDLLRAYGEGEHPWCILDTHQRNLERRWHAFDFGLDARHSTLERLVARARQRYMEVGGTLAEQYVRSLTASKFAIPGMRRQVDTYATFVRPALDRGKTAYVLVDALRFEMARELMASLQNEYAAELTLAVGTIPTITELGMAALMPGAEGGVTIVPTAEGKLGLRVAEAILKDRKSRVDWFCSQPQGPVAVATMENVLPKPRRPLQNEMQAARVILVTSQEIDALCESDNIHLARKAMDDVLPELSRLVNRLRDVGCTTIVVTADHGYLFGDELDTDMKIDPPGGQTVDLHRRVWVGRGGSNDPAYLRVPLSRLGLSDDLELAAPWGFAVFKVQGGARAYFHGGLSPQEMAVPVMVLTPVAAGPTASPAATSWALVPGSKKISTRFFSVQVTGEVSGLFGPEPTRVHVEVRSTDRSNKSQVLSVPVAASYGFIEATGDVEVRMKGDESQTVDPNTVTLMITTPAEQAVVAVYLLDAVTGRELAVLPRVDMTIAL